MPNTKNAPRCALYYLAKLRLEITRQDRRQLTRSLVDKRHYHNPHGLGLMLAQVTELEHAVENAIDMWSTEPSAVHVLAHQMCRRFTNGPAARKIIRELVRDHGLTFTAWEGFRDKIEFVEGRTVKPGAAGGCIDVA